MDRRLMLGGVPWSPQTAGAVAWYYAAGQYVDLSGSVVNNWNDKLANGNDIIQVAPGFQPTWESVNGWSANRSSIRAVSQPLSSPSGGLAPIESVFSGLDKPFSVLLTCQDLVLSSSSTVAKWTGSGSVAQSCIINNSNFLSITRSDGVNSSAITATVSAMGSGHTRLAFTFDGATGAAYLGTARAVSGTIGGGPSDPGSMSFTSFTLGDVRDLRYTEVIVLPRALSAAEIALYYAYSLNEWGA